MKRTPHTMLITLLRWSLLATLLLGFAAQAEPVARVLMANGDVRAIQSDQSVRALNRGDMLYAGDTIRTGKTSSTQFRFTDGALIALRAESEFNIEQHHYNEQTPQQNEQSGQLVRGGLRAITGAIGRERPEAVNMRTPVATIGIRGTVYETIYIPPGGHPALPGVESGHYTVVLRGRVSISNAAGELIIGDGEIAFVRDANTPPVLRPDLSALFARFAALDNIEELIEQIAGDESGNDAVRKFYDTMVELFGQSSRVVTPGPIGFVAVTGFTPETNYTGSFLSEPVTMTDDLLSAATNGTGDINSFSANILEIIDSGSALAGDSQIYWGSYWDNNFEILDVNGDPLDMGASEVRDAYYIVATNVLLNTSDLPTSGSYTYYLVGDAGSTNEGSPSLDSNSRLTVNFAGTMEAFLSLFGGQATWETISPQAISAFYGSGLSLEGSSGTGQIAGRFVGSDAEGAISYYLLNETEIQHIGVAGFSRTVLSPEPFGFLGILSSKIDGPIDALWGEFFEQPVSMSGDFLLQANGGSGDLTSFILTDEPAVATTGTGQYITGDSTIYWGGYSSSDEVVTFAYTPTGDPAWWEEANYIIATKVIDKLTDVSLLSSLGTVTYESVGGSWWLSSGSSLTVDFATALMSVDLTVQSEGTWLYTAIDQPIADFYGNGILMDHASGSGILAGRFVGTNAEGAIAIFDGFYDWGEGMIDNFLGTVAFDRLASEIIPQ